MSHRIPAAAAALSVVVVLAGCGKTTIDGAKGEQLITRTVEERSGVDVRTVKCPRELVAKAGETFRCTVTGSDGSTGEVVVTERDDKGSVSIDAPFLPIGEVETSIGDSLTRRNGAETSVRCPEIVELAEGDRFTCDTRSGGERRRIRVTQQDDRGRVRYAFVS